MTPTAQAAVAAVADVWEQPEAGIIGKRRYRHLTVPRFFAWLLLDDAGLTVDQIGRDFDRDHTSILNGIRRAEEMACHPHWRERWGQAQNSFIRAQEARRVRALPRFYRHGHFQEATQ